MSIFQPSDSSATRVTTPSEAAQAMARYKAGILGQLLDAAAQSRPSFADFAKRGASLPARLPGGLSGGIGDLLAAMSQPGAFDTQVTETGKPSAPSLFSDLSQLGILGALLYQSGALGAGADKLGSILSGVGGALGIGGVNPALGDAVPAADAGASFNQAGSNLNDAIAGIGQPSPYDSTDLLSAMIQYGLY